MKTIIAFFAFVLVCSQAQMGGWTQIDPTEVRYDNTWNQYLYIGLNKAVEKAYQSGVLRSTSVLLDTVYSAKFQVVNGVNIHFIVGVIDLASLTYHGVEFTVYVSPSSKDVSLQSYNFTYPVDDYFDYEFRTV